LTDWRWVNLKVVQAIHDRQLAEHGGLDGIRDPGALDSALARPRNLVGYADPAAEELAASYIVGVARAHAFADGNKRTAWVVGQVFLADNGYTLTVDRQDAVLWVIGAATGTISEEQLSVLLRGGLKRD
jgi:death-on-curing protein